MKTHINRYRLDIQGLRALAVLFVMIFHILPTFMPAGYLGVDIFFVISGFLITSLLLKDYNQNNRISLLNFYKRRILRIFPAVIFTSVIVLTLMFILGLQDEIGNVFSSVKSSLLAITNFYFYNLGDTGDYWNPDLFRPLLHLWSLSVEEQFYLIFPVFFMFFIKNKKIFVWFLIVMFFASIISASFIIHDNKNLAYYMPYSRAFALILGCLTAFLNINFNTHNKIIIIFIELISCLSIFCIVLGCYFLSKYNLPSYLTLIVIIPVAILLFIGKNHTTLVHKFLGNKVLSYIGLYSFSIYLVHFWLWSFYSYWQQNQVGFTAKIIIIWVSIILGALQYYVIEETFRYKKYSFFTVFLLFVIFPFISYFVLYKANSLYNLYINVYRPQAIVNIKEIQHSNILLFGDSNALHYYYTMQKISQFINFKFNTNAEHGEYNYNCLLITTKCINILHDYDVIILGYAFYYDHIRYSNELKAVEKQQKQLTALFKDAQKQGKTIIILGEIPKMESYSVSNALFFIDIHFDNINFNYEIYKNGILKNNQLIEQLTKKFNNVYYINFNNLLLKNKQIIYYDKPYYLYYNKSHLSQDGSKYVGKKYIEMNHIDSIFYKLKKIYKVTK